MFSINYSWLACRYQNGTSLRGVACDCTGLILGLYADRGVRLPVNYNYSAYWYMKKNCNELMLPYLERFFDRVETLEEGDCISYKFGRSGYAHLALYLDKADNKIIHCSADFGVEIIRREQLQDRETGFWRLKWQYLEKLTR